VLHVKMQKTTKYSVSYHSAALTSVQLTMCRIAGTSHVVLLLSQLHEVRIQFTSLIVIIHKFLQDEYELDRLPQDILDDQK